MFYEDETFIYTLGATIAHNEMVKMLESLNSIN